MREPEGPDDDVAAELEKLFAETDDLAAELEEKAAQSETRD
ncbi:MAG TPA: hypothetical protein VGH27_04340 [Streptosporangiaceae bacterium]